MSQNSTPLGLRMLLNQARMLSGTSAYWPLSNARTGTGRTQILMSISIRMQRLILASLAAAVLTQDAPKLYIPDSPTKCEIAHRYLEGQKLAIAPNFLGACDKCVGRTLLAR